MEHENSFKSYEVRRRQRDGDGAHSRLFIKRQFHIKFNIIMHIEQVLNVIFSKVTSARKSVFKANICGSKPFDLAHDYSIRPLTCARSKGREN